MLGPLIDKVDRAATARGRLAGAVDALGSKLLPNKVAEASTNCWRLHCGCRIGAGHCTERLLCPNPPWEVCGAYCGACDEIP